MAGSSTVVGLNGFRAVVRPGTFTAHVRALPDPRDLEQLRAAAGKGWALRWQDGTLYGLPNGAVNGLEGAAKTTLDVREHLGFVAYLNQQWPPRRDPALLGVSAAAVHVPRPAPRVRSRDPSATAGRCADPRWGTPQARTGPAPARRADRPPCR